ncbi:MAG TPA: RNA polymerase sigma factor [Blastocatellia bacterium]|nr:RNA polymerase sigma factor [Blastocatellia bacterium]
MDNTDFLELLPSGRRITGGAEEKLVRGNWYRMRQNRENRADLPDAELLLLMQSGDELAFQTLYRRRQATVYRFALQMSGSESVAEDVTQEVFMTLIKIAGQYDPNRSAITTFLYGIARNYVLRRLNSDKPYVALSEQGDGEESAPMEFVTDSDPLAELTRNERIDTIRNAVVSLPPHYREVVVFCDLNELSYEEAAEVLGCAVGTVRSRLHRARKLLFEKLKNTVGHEENPGGMKQARCLV